MKYSSTPRLINTIVFTLLATGFGFLGIYFGFLVTPFLWDKIANPPVEVPYLSVALALMLGSVGIAGFVLSLLGLFHSIKSLAKGKDDVSVLKAFNCYFAIGYVLVAALLLNAVWLIRLTTTNFNDSISVVFVIIVYLIGVIAVMIATNIPLVKVYADDESGKSIGDVLSLASIAGGASVALVSLVSCLVTVAGGNGAPGQSVIATKFAVFGAIPLVGALVAFFGSFLGRKNPGSKASVSMLYGSLGVYGIGIMVCGLFSVLQNDSKKDKYSFMFQGKSTNYGYWANWLDSTVLSFVVGGLIFLGAIALIVITFVPKKEKKAKSAY